MGWSAYEQKAWDDIQSRKRSWFEETAGDSWTHRVGGRIADRASQAGNAVRKIPGVNRVGAAFGTAARKAQEALVEVSSRTLSERMLLRAYGKAGVAVDSLGGLREIDLERLDRFVHKQRLHLFYGGIAAAEGAAAGLFVSGGEAAAAAGGVAGAGAGAAPGFGAIAATMAGDAAFVLALSGRAVADTAMHYGFDPDDPREQLFMLTVINLGSALTQGAKYTALADLSKLTQALVRNAPWTQLNQHILTKVAQQFAKDYSTRLTKQKLGQLVPVVGVGVGASLNYAAVARAQHAAYWAYRERLLMEKNPVAADLLEAEIARFQPAAGDPELEPSIEVTGLLEAAEQGELEEEEGSTDDTHGDG